MTQNIEVMNQWFKRNGERIVTQRWMVLLGILVFTGIAALGIPKLQVEVSVENLFAEDDPLTIAKNEFNEVFGNSHYVSVLVEANDVFAPDILRMMRELGEELLETVPYAQEIVSLTDYEFTQGTDEGMDIIEVVPQDIPETAQEIEEIRALAFSKIFLINRLFSDDSRQAWLTLRLSPYPEETKHTTASSPELVVGEEVLKVLRQEKYQGYTLKPSGFPVLSYQETVYFDQETVRLVGLSLLVAMIILLLTLRTLRGVLVPTLTFICANVWVFGTMGHLGILVDNVAATLPFYFGVVVSIGYSIHLFNFFRRHFAVTGDRRASVLYAVGETGWPTFFTATTTIGALSSFYFVPIRRIQWMGLSSAAVVVATYVLVMTLTPVLLDFGKNKAAQLTTERHTPPRSEQFFVRFSDWLLTHRKIVIGIFVLFIAVFVAGLPFIVVSVNYEDTYGLRVPYIKDIYEIGQSKIGSMYAYDVTLTFEEPGIVKTPDVLQNFDAFSSEISAFPLTKRVSSLLDIVKDMNQIMHSNIAEYYRVPDDADLIAQLLLMYEISNGVEQENWVDYDYTTLRLMVEIKDFDTAKVEREFETIKTLAADLFPGATLGMVGSSVQFAVLQNYVTKGEITSCSIALVVIGLLMILVFQSVKVGLIGMIPNVSPVLVILGLMGYLRIPLDMTTMAVAPILLGLAVDDTIHFMNHCKLEFQRCGSYIESIRQTFKTVGKSVFMTSLILVASFSAYLLGTVNFFINLGFLMMAGVSAALLADYFMTPILIEWFQPFGEEKQQGRPEESGNS